MVAEWERILTSATKDHFVAISGHSHVGSLNAAINVVL
jgi:hypothetical protein